MRSRCPESRTKACIRKPTEQVSSGGIDDSYCISSHALIVCGKRNFQRCSGSLLVHPFRGGQVERRLLLCIYLPQKLIYQKPVSPRSCRHVLPSVWKDSPLTTTASTTQSTSTAVQLTTYKHKVQPRVSEYSASCLKHGANSTIINVLLRSRVRVAINVSS